MIRVLGRKQNSDNAKWLDAASRIEELVSKKEVTEAAKLVLDEIKTITAGKKVAYAWSGGKDALVIEHLCKKLKIKGSVFVHTNLEYPEFLAWCLENKPDGCEVINTGQDLEWLSKRQGMLFPQTSPVQSRWFSLVQQAGIRAYFKKHELDMIIVGHRTADGNYVGKGTNISHNNAGITRYSPIASWPHELVLAYIHYNEISVPPIYAWKDGYRCGTHPWPSRMGMKSVNDGWSDVYEIDPSIVKEAAAKIDSAALFLEGVAAK